MCGSQWKTILTSTFCNRLRSSTWWKRRWRKNFSPLQPPAHKVPRGLCIFLGNTYPPPNHTPEGLPGVPAPGWRPPRRGTTESLTTGGEHPQSPEAVEEVLAVGQVFPGQNQGHIQCFQLQCLLSKLFIYEHRSMHRGCVAHSFWRLYDCGGEEGNTDGRKKISTANETYWSY